MFTGAQYFRNCWMETQLLLANFEKILFAPSKCWCQSLGDVVLTCYLVSCRPSSLHGSLSEVPDLACRRGLDLPHPAGTPHGPGQLGGGLLHRHLPAR